MTIFHTTTKTLSAMLLVFSLGFLPITAQAAKVRIKDLVEFDGVRGNDLLGYGLVVGLNGTGDGIRNSPFTELSLAEEIDLPVEISL
jgi:flagellar P-ring protein FlgI